MQQSSKTVIKVIITLIVVMLGYRLLFPPAISDSQQIRSQLSNAIVGANNRDVSAIMKPVSEHFTDTNGYNAEQLHLMLAQNIPNCNSVTVVPSNLTVTVNGDTAQTDEYVTITAFGDANANFAYHGHVVLEWKKEPDTRFLVIPTTTWRVVKSDTSIIGTD